MEISCTVTEPLKTDSVKAWFEYNKGYNSIQLVDAKLVKGVMTAKIGNLQPSSNYNIVAKAENKFGIGSSNKKQVTTDSGEESKPTVGVPSITDIKANGAHVESIIKIVDTDYKALSGGFEYSTSSYMYSPYSKKGTLENDTILKLNLSELSENSIYYIRAYIDTDLGKVYSTTTNFTTAERKPIISDLNVKKILKTSVNFSAMVKPYDENSSITEAGVQYTTYSYFSSGTTKLKGTITGDSVFVDLTNINKGTKYLMRAYAVSGNKYYYGPEKNITTKSDADYTPNITEIIVSDTTMTSMTLSSTYTLVNEDYKMKEAGFQYYKSSSSSYVSSGSLYAGNIIDGTITLSVSNLTENSTYQVRPYVKLDDESVYYGNTISVKTKQASDYAPSFTDIVVSDTTMTSMTLKSTYNVENETYKVVEAGFQYYASNYSSYVDNGKLYSCSSNDKSIVLKLSELNANTTYQIRPYVKLDNGTIYYGKTIGVKTKNVEDYIGKVSVSEILIRSAKLKASIKDLPTNYQIVETGFHYYEISGNYIMMEKKIAVEMVNGNIQLDISSLKSSSNHKARAYVKYSLGTSTYTSYGKLTDFTTLSITVLPSVVCNDITSVNTSSFSIEADVKENHKSYPITEAGFVYIKSTSSSALTLDTNNAIRKPLTIQKGKVKLTVDGLEENSTYLVRAYVMSGDEVTYNEKTIKVYTNMDNYKPTMGTLSVEKTNGEYIASCEATVSQIFTITDSGFVYSKSTNLPTLESNDGIVSAQISESLISGKIPFEKPQTGSTRYYVRAYARNTNGITYSSYKTVTVSWND